MADINDEDWVQYLQQNEVIENEEDGIKRFTLMK